MTDDAHIFQQLVARKGREHWRDMPWRADVRPYYVLVSELMLQQTQVTRVVPKFEAFVAQFPDVQTLAAATLADVLKLWQGLGYNRRAKYLHDAARLVASCYGGELPSDEPRLVQLPGVGRHTAGAIRVYAFDQPSLFVETNIRTVYLHHFFAGRDSVGDDEIIAKLDATLDREHPRRFYQALMDYGAWLKSAGVRNTSVSQQYRRQSRFDGSVRQVRGEIIRALTYGSPLTLSQLRQRVAADERFSDAYDGLKRDGLISQRGRSISLTNR
ncbi:endonuclease III [Candidatus Saccharibacteria bacterium]|nr:MAG: endonuclease III [Candidatus Saccharibacteria bacterium]